MTDDVIIADKVSKKFRRGEYHDSLRDLVPALFKRAARMELSTRKDEFWALRDVSFRIGRGEAVALIGHNGAGKSTLLKHLTGIFQPTSGTLSVRGRMSALIELGAGFHPDLTGRENVFLNGAILGMNRREIARKFDAIVEFSGLAEFIDTPVKRYSSGMYARLGFSVAIHVEPEVLIVDEVLSVGDLAFQRKCTTRMNEVIRSGTTVVFVSHSTRAVAELCKRTIMLERGGVVHDGPTATVISKYLEGLITATRDVGDVAVQVTAPKILGGSEDAAAFTAGTSIRVEVRALARQRAQAVNLGLFIRDAGFQEVFNVTGERLGGTPVDLAPGEACAMEVELTLNLGPGEYFLGSQAARSLDGFLYDRVEVGQSIVITSENRAGGVAQLFPKAMVEQGRHELV